MISLEEENELVLSEDWNTPPIFRIPFNDIKDVKIVATNEGEISSKNDLVLSITFSTKDDSTPYVASPISIRMTPEESIQTILIDVDDKEINSLLDTIRSLKQIDDDDNSKLQLKASIQGITLCMGCHKNNSIFIFSNDQLCGPCFKERYGDIVMRADYGQYYGGHKLHLAGGKFGDYESGKMYLTNTHFIFNKGNKERQKIWEIIIPLNSIDLDGWRISEESRRKNIVMGGAGTDNAMFASGIINESGKRHRIVIPYVDENGINQSPIFGISSFSGNAIRDWAANLYRVVIDNRKTSSNLKTDEVSPLKDHENVTDPLTIAKLRFAKGEISKEEFEEMKKLLE